MSKRPKCEAVLDPDYSEEHSSNIQNSKCHTAVSIISIYQNSCLQKHLVRTENTL